MDQMALLFLFISIILGFLATQVVGGIPGLLIGILRCFVFILGFIFTPIGLFLTISFAVLGASVEVTNSLNSPYSSLQHRVRMHREKFYFKKIKERRLFYNKWNPLYFTPSTPGRCTSVRTSGRKCVR